MPRPEQWEWSSYPGYRAPRRRQDWVAHEALLAAWRGDYGGKDPAAAYVRFVEAGLTAPPPSPFREAFGGWISGLPRFIDQLRTQAGPVLSNPPAPEALQLAGLDPELICCNVAEFYGLDRSALSHRYNPRLARAIAAWLCRRHNEAPHRVLAERPCLSCADSVPNRTRGLEARLRRSPGPAQELEQIMSQVRSRTVGPPIPDSLPRRIEASTAREKRGPLGTGNEI